MSNCLVVAGFGKTGNFNAGNRLDEVRFVRKTDARDDDITFDF